MLIASGVSCRFIMVLLSHVALARRKGIGEERRGTREGRRGEGRERGEEILYLIEGVATQPSSTAPFRRNFLQAASGALKREGRSSMQKCISHVSQQGTPAHYPAPPTTNHAAAPVHTQALLNARSIRHNLHAGMPPHVDCVPYACTLCRVQWLRICSRARAVSRKPQLRPGPGC